VLNFVWSFIPNANPDGYAITFEGNKSKPLECSISTKYMLEFLLQALVLLLACYSLWVKKKTFQIY
jgi:hypothetical protein